MPAAADAEGERLQKVLARVGFGSRRVCEDLIAEAVLGWEVASKLGVSIGDQIEPTHGVEGDHAHEHEHLWTVTGILKETSWLAGYQVTWLAGYLVTWLPGNLVTW